MASPEEMAQTMINNMEAKTGKTLDAWLAHVSGTSLTKHGEIVKHLKSEHDVTHGFANLIAQVALKGLQIVNPSSKDEDDLVVAQYSGAKANLKPVYDKLVAAVAAFGDDVELAPKKAYVSLRRNKQFGIVQPSTKTRVDVGINLKGFEPTDRLETSGSFNQMVSHRVRLAEPGDVDAELVQWLQEAYNRA